MITPGERVGPAPETRPRAERAQAAERPHPLWDSAAECLRLSGHGLLLILVVERARTAVPPGSGLVLRVEPAVPSKRRNEYWVLPPPGSPEPPHCRTADPGGHTETRAESKQLRGEGGREHGAWMPSREGAPREAGTAEEGLAFVEGEHKTHKQRPSSFRW